MSLATYTAKTWTDYADTPCLEALELNRIDSGIAAVTAEVLSLEALLPSTYQPISAELSALAGLSSTGYAKRSGAASWSVVPSIPQSDVTGLTAALAGLQPLDSDLTAIAALTTANFGRSLLTVADAAAARTALGAQVAGSYEPALGNPGTSGWVLSSTAAGVRSWVALPAAGVSSMFGRTGAVVAASGDYSAYYLGLTAQAADSAKLGGQLPSYYALASAIPAASSTTPASLGTAAIGTGTTWARADHVHAMPTAAQVGAQPVGNYAICTGAYTASDAWTRSISPGVIGSVDDGGASLSGEPFSSWNSPYITFGSASNRVVQIVGAYDQDVLAFRRSGSAWGAWNNIWHSGNLTFAGSGSAISMSRSDHTHAGQYLPISGGALSGWVSAGPAYIGPWASNSAGAFFGLASGNVDSAWSGMLFAYGHTYVTSQNDIYFSTNVSGKKAVFGLPISGSDASFSGVITRGGYAVWDAGNLPNAASASCTTGNIPVASGSKTFTDSILSQNGTTAVFVKSSGAGMSTVAIASNTDISTYFGLQFASDGTLTIYPTLSGEVQPYCAKFQSNGAFLPKILNINGTLASSNFARYTSSAERTINISKVVHIWTASQGSNNQTIPNGTYPGQLLMLKNLSGNIVLLAGNISTYLASFFGVNVTSWIIWNGSNWE